jgi:CheY-like chemotaxis protein
VTDRDPDFLASFMDDYFAECDEHLASIRRLLLALESSRGSQAAPPDVIEELFRSCHSIKGISGMVQQTSAEALARLDAMLASQTPPDVIVSDIGRPDEDGYRLMQQLVRRPRTRGGQIPVIAMTAYGRPQDRKRALAAGFRLHLVKPVEPQVLASAIRSVLPSSAR